MKGHLEIRDTKKKLPRGQHKWSLIIETGRDAAGVRGRKRYTFFGTKTEAETELGRKLHQLETGALVINDRYTVAEYLKHWLEAYAKPSTAPRTYERYQQLVDTHLAPTIGSHKLVKLTPLHLQNLYSDLLKSGRCDGEGGLSPQTVVHIHRVLHKALKQALLWGLVMRNVTEAVSPPKVERSKPDVLDVDQVKKLLEKLKGQDLYLPVLLALHTGMRAGEILGLRWQDVDLESGTVTVGSTLQVLKGEDGKGELSMKPPKSNAGRRSIPLTQETIEALKAHSAAQADHIASRDEYHHNNLVVCRSDGSHWHPRSFSADWTKARKTAGVTCRFHDLRHTHASLMLRSGTHPKALQERLGHSTAAFTMNVYAHLLPGVQEEAVANFEAMLTQARNKPEKAED